MWEFGAGMLLFLVFFLLPPAVAGDRAGHLASSCSHTHPDPAVALGCGGDVAASAAGR